MEKEKRQIKNGTIDLALFERPRSLNDMAYESIKRGILSGALVLGEVYSELKLAKRFGISRTPVREALLRLSTEKLIRFHPRKGMSINYFAGQDIESLFELRQAIEENIVRKIIKELTDQQIQELKDIVTEQEDCLNDGYDENRFLEIDRRFHLFLVEAGKNRFMVQTYDSIRDYMAIPAMKALVKPGRAHAVIKEHREIVKALTDKNLKGVREAIRKHLNTSKLAAMEEETFPRKII